MGNIVNSDFLAATYTAFKALYTKVFNEYIPEHERLCLQVPSDTKEGTYELPGSPPKMKQWKDERQPGGLVTANFSILNYNWEATLEVDRNDLEDDRLGLIRPQIEGLAISARRHPGKLIYELIRDGDSTKCWDNQYFFDTDHVFGASGTQSNKLTGTGTTISQLEADWSTVYEYFRTLKDDQGEPLGLAPDLVMCHPSLEKSFKKLFNALIISNTTNILVNDADCICNPYLTDKNDWYAFVTKSPLKPFVHQVRQQPEFVDLAKPDSPEAFMRRKFLYGVAARYNAGYGLWQLAAKVTNT